MAIETAKCTLCGAIIEVDTIKDAIICPICHEAIVTEKAIKNYAGTKAINITAESSDFVIVARELKKYCGASNEVIIPDGVIKIGDGVFREMGITHIKIPESVKTIGKNAFFGCQDLASVIIPRSVTNIEEEAFCECSSLKEITIPSSVKVIGAYSFRDCKGLVEITVENGVESIGVGAFAGCTALSEVNIPESVTAIGAKTFQGCTSLSCFTVSDSVIEIGGFAFLNCRSLKKLTLGKCVKRIQGCAFSDCAAIEELYYKCEKTDFVEKGALLPFRSAGKNGMRVIIASNVKSIPECLFAYNPNISSVKFESESNCISIGNAAFFSCKNLTDIEIPASIRKIDINAFYECEKIRSVYISDLAAWCNIDFANEASTPACCGGADLYLCGELLKNITLPPEVKIVKCFTFRSFKRINEVVLHDGVTAIQTKAFVGCNLRKITVPASVTRIFEYAFFECTELKEWLFKGETYVEIGNIRSNSVLTVPKTAKKNYKTAVRNQILANKVKLITY